MEHLDLFTGIGGFSLAARWAGIRTVAMCEIEEFPRKVLQKNFPGIPIHHDIRELNGSEYAGIDIITGGFPCQPYSRAGKQQGEGDARDLWPEMLRVISESRPRWVVGENSSNILNMAFDQIKADLEAIGYEVGEPLCIPAGAVNADHRRERSWICANSNQVGLQRSSEETVQRVAGLPIEPAGIFPSKRSRSSISKPENLRGYTGIPSGVDRIKALGNAVVPQVAYEILRCIRAVHNQKLAIPPIDS
jgi:DNA (cytosine-5)-methyltransferase 1